MSKRRGRKNSEEAEMTEPSLRGCDYGSHGVKEWLERCLGTSLVVWWLKLCTPNAGAWD